MEDFAPIAWNGTVTLGTVLIGGRLLMNGIYKKLDNHDKSINEVKVDVAYIKGKLEDE